jgi:hypothetical protein
MPRQKRRWRSRASACGTAAFCSRLAERTADHPATPGSMHSSVGSPFLVGSKVVILKRPQPIPDASWGECYRGGPQWLAQSSIPRPQGGAGAVIVAIRRLASYSTNTSSRTALSSSRTPAAGFAPRASCRRRSMAGIDPARAASGSRPAILPASPCGGRSENWNR